MKRITSSTLSIIIGVNLLFLAACSNNAPVSNRQVGTVSKESVVTVKQGTVTSVKNVAIMGRRGNAGGTIGSVTGSVLAAGGIAGSIIGSLVGGAIGSEADKELSKQAGLEISVQLANGERVIVTQLAETSFRKGDKVQLIMRDDQASVTHLQSNS